MINAKGELLGLAFDGNYEALSHKIAYDKDLNRTICVDIRAVLWTIDKVGGDQTRYQRVENCEIVTQKLLEKPFMSCKDLGGFCCL